MNPRTAWELEYCGVFVDMCVDQRRLGKVPGTKHWFESFEDMMFDMEQVKFHWDALVKQWKTWCNLVQCSDMKWDPETKIFGASDEDWANYLQVNPNAGAYRVSPPSTLEKLEKIFEGCNIDVGDDDEAGPSECKRKRNMHQEEEEEADDDTERLNVSYLSKPRRRKIWTRALHELFLDLLVRETLKGKKPGSSFPKGTWSMIRRKIFNTAGKDYTLKQLKNHWDVLRKEWKVWCKLVGDPIMKWDPNTRRFGATEEDWKKHLQENSKAVQFKRKIIRSPEKVAIIYRGVIEPGKIFCHGRGKRVKSRSESPQIHDQTPLPTIHTNEPVMGIEDGDHSEPSDTPICTPLEAERLSSLIVSPIEYENTIGECIEHLDAMEGIEKGSDLYLFALDLFLKKEYREIFLKLKSSSSKMSLLLNLQATLPTVAV